MKWWLLVLGACGGGSATGPKPALPTLDSAVEKALAEAAQRHDAAAIASFFTPPVAYGGLWFEDAACTQQFAGATAITAEALPAFAQCLAMLPLTQLANPKHTTLVEARGVELSLAYAFDGQHAHITGIGHARVPDEPPTTASIAVKQLTRTAGESMVVPSDHDRTLISQTNHTRLAGVVVACLDPSGAVSRVTTRKSTGSSNYDSLIVERVKTWRYEPIVIGGTQVEACTELTFLYSQR